MTIGCLASQYKLTDQVIEAWAEILHRTDARMLIRNRTLGRVEHQEHLCKRFAERGIGRDRIQLEGPADHFEFLSTYARIDFALDPFPYSGGTTTTEALWQGVPVVTFDGDRWASRTSASLLKAAGLAEFVAADRQGYVDLCVQLANSPETPPRLATFRKTIRDALRKSHVCDTASFAKSMEELYLQMAQESCQR
jgi:predicted O-linked N-acetylglucosamine transferase (SPINDLY family)